MAINEIHQNDIGTNFTVTMKDGSAVVDISSATTKNIIFTKPGGTNVTKTMSFVTDGSNGQLVYSIESGVLDTVGQWQYQIYLVFSSGSFYSDIGEFIVHRNL